MDLTNSYKDSKQYSAYCRNTDEKEKLHRHIAQALASNPRRILDIGCGNGINAAFLSDLFPEAQIDGLERSVAQIETARTRNHRVNVCYIQTPFEEFVSSKEYDFVLMSHVLQYIDSDLPSFIEKAASILSGQGELWLIQQTKQGMAEIISHQKPYLTNPRFKDWKTFEDFRPIIENTLGKCGSYDLKSDFLDSSFKDMNFSNPSEEDKLRLEFIFCLDSSFDNQSEDFKAHLAKLALSKDGRIAHPNGILKVRKVK